MADGPAAPKPAFGRLAQALYGVGALSSGIKVTMLSSFLLIFYHQAVGLEPTRIGFAISLVMLADAVFDPLVGYVSDHMRTPWGRRHPLMYFSALPLAIGFFMLWNPPAELTEDGLFWWLVGCLLAIRLMDTFFEVPSIALGPELESDYDRRTTVVSSRIFFRTVGGLSVTILGMQWFLRPLPDGSGGVTDRSGYTLFAFVMAMMMIGSILVTAISTHRFIPWLRGAAVNKTAVTHSRFATLKRDVVSLLTNRSALTMLAVGMVVAIASGVRTGLELYFSLYFWELAQTQISVLAAISACGALTATVVVPFVSARLGKRRGMITCYLLSVVNSSTPVALRLLGVMPENGDPALFYILTFTFFMQGGLYVMTAVIMNSMLADVVEDVAVTSGQRSEGLLFSTDQFFSKAVSGIGVLVSSTVLTVIAFPRDAKPGELPEEMLTQLATLYLPTSATLVLTVCGLLMLFKIDRQRHEENLRRLATGAATPGPS